MLMSVIWLAMLAASILYGAYSGNSAAVSEAIFAGAQAAVQLCISIAGALCLWSAVMELMSQSGLSEALARLLKPFLRKIYPRAFSDDECAAALSANFTANLLGLGNAATPAGLRAAERMSRLPGAERELSRLVVMNSSSLQLIPATVAAVRASLGCGSAFDILPCVWLTSIAAVAVGLISVRLMEGKAK